MRHPIVSAMLYGMKYPVRVLPGTQSSGTHCLHSTAQLSIEIIARCQPSGWIFVGSQFGSLLHAFMKLNRTMSRLPYLLIEHCPIACTTCKLVLPSAIIAHSNFASFSAMLQMLTSSPTIHATTMLCSMGETVKQILVNSLSIAGIDLHAPS